MKKPFVGPGFECKIGDYTYGFEHIEVVLHGANLYIGKFCSIAVGVKLFLGLNHRTDWISTYPFGGRYKGIFKYNGPRGYLQSKGDVNIGNDVYIGIDSRIMSGVKIGDGAVIGAHTVVAKDVPPYSIVVGNPGRVVKKRFNEEDISFLLKLKWWDLPIDEINAIIPYLTSSDIKGLRYKYLDLKQ